MRTVAVVEMANDDLQAVRCFEDTPDGTAEAEEMFKRLAIENGAEESEVEGFLNDEYYETGTYQLWITYSK